MGDRVRDLKLFNFGVGVHNEQFQKQKRVGTPDIAFLHICSRTNSVSCVEIVANIQKARSKNIVAELVLKLL